MGTDTIDISKPRLYNQIYSLKWKDFIITWINFNKEWLYEVLFQDSNWYFTEKWTITYWDAKTMTPNETIKNIIARFGCAMW